MPRILTSAVAAFSVGLFSTLPVTQATPNGSISFEENGLAPAAVNAASVHRRNNDDCDKIITENNTAKCEEICAPLKNKSTNENCIACFKNCFHEKQSEKQTCLNEYEDVCDTIKSKQNKLKCKEICGPLKKKSKKQNCRACFEKKKGEKQTCLNEYEDVCDTIKSKKNNAKCKEICGPLKKKSKKENCRACFEKKKGEKHTCLNEYCDTTGPVTPPLVPNGPSPEDSSSEETGPSPEDSSSEEIDIPPTVSSSEETGPSPEESASVVIEMPPSVIQLESEDVDPVIFESSEDSFNWWDGEDSGEMENPESSDGNSDEVDEPAYYATEDLTGGAVGPTQIAGLSATAMCGSVLFAMEGVWAQ